jgi:muramoyltetrapeptide carboxypeptidase
MSEIRIPPYLQAGDTIGICATARKISREEMAPAIAILQAEGFRVKLAEHLFESEHQFSGSDEMRTTDLQQLINDEEVKAIISARGGYGTMRIIDKIDFSAFKQRPKWIVGYSDITVLHSHVLQQCKTATLHATMPINFLQDEESTTSLFRALRGEAITYLVENKTGLPNISGTAEGEIVGGNLSLLYALQGSVSDIDTNGKILFIEDLDEYLYHIDRMILSLDRAGKFSGINGLIVGGMNAMKDNAVPFGKTAEEIIHSHLAKYNIPICFGFPAGHDVKNWALPFGKKIKIEVNHSNATLNYY